MIEMLLRILSDSVFYARKKQHHEIPWREKRGSVLQSKLAVTNF